MKTVIEMARKSKLDIYGLGCPHDKFIECVEAFAELVRADEREACAKVCDIKAEVMAITGKSCDPDDLAAAIRAIDINPASANPQNPASSSL
jgi:hypothetical protein